MARGQAIKGRNLSDSSLVSRLVRAALLWAVPILLLTGFALSWLYRSSTYKIFDDPLITTVTALITTAETIVQDDGNVIIALNREPLDPKYQSALSGRYYAVLTRDPEGGAPIVKIPSRSLYDGEIAFEPGEMDILFDNPGMELRTFARGPDDEPLRIVARSIILPDLDTPVVMMAAADQRPATRDIQQFAFISILLIAALTLGLIGAIILQVRLGLRPLFDLRERVAAVREGRADRVTGDYPQEIAPLADELNSLIEHNQDIVERARTHVGNLAHALKTPLAVLRNESSGNKDALAQIVLRQTEQMNKQVDHHLARARAAARAQITSARADVSTSLQDLSRTLAKIYQRRGIAISETLPHGLQFRGERRDLDDMVGNLLDNAYKWAKSHVRLMASEDPENADSVLVIIEDDGPGIDEGQIDQALKRGVRLDETTPGTGFGLSIVDDLARAYGGGLRLGRSSIGGLKAELRLPRGAPVE